MEGGGNGALLKPCRNQDHNPNVKYARWIYPVEKQ